MPNLITIDFETYYDSDYSLTKLSTEQYVNDPRFEAIGFAYKINDEPTVWEPSWRVGMALRNLPWADSFVLAHNTMFDGAILSWKYGGRPKGWLDTLSMGRALHGVEAGGSLKAMAERYGVGVKGTEVLDAKGKRSHQFSPTELAKYGGYCENDVELAHNIFHKMMAAGFPLIELKLIDLTLKMYVEPVLKLDNRALELHLEDTAAQKQGHLVNALSAIGRKDLALKQILGDEETRAGIRKELMSNPKFAAILEALVDEDGNRSVPNIPKKISMATGKETYAFAKSDEPFKALLQHEDVRVQALCAARLGTKSTLEESRTQRFIDIGQRNGVFPVPLKYYAAHTGRWGGSDSVNLQNLPSRGPNAGKLKKAILAPEGYVFIDADSSQIEARTLAWEAGQDDLVESFARGEDVYKIMAAAIYGKAEQEITKEERFVGKTTILGCISEGTLVLSNSGWKPIERVTLEDKLWDGEEWVCHQGLQNSGIKETLNLCGVWLTSDHKVWSGTQWLEAQSLVRDANTRSQALDIAVANLPLQATFADTGEALLHLSSNVTANPMSTAWTAITSKVSKARAVRFVPKLHRTSNGTGCIRTQWPTTDTELDCSIDCLLPSQGATTQPTKHIPTMEGVAYQCTSNGERVEPRFFTMYKRLKGGMSRVLKWTGLMSTATTSPTTSDLYPEVTTLETNEKLQTSNRKLQTYDLAYAGPRNRYMVLTARGPMIVHNCGYGMGGLKFQAQLKTFGTDLSTDECARIISVYRSRYPKIPQLWRESQEALRCMVRGQTTKLCRNDLLTVDDKGILLPNGLHIFYNGIREIADAEGKRQFVYDTRTGPNKIYGGKCVENFTQAVARCIIGEQMLKIAKRYKVVLTVHDAIGIIARREEADEARAYVESCMRWVPAWAEGLPVNCESGMGDSYGDC